MKTELILILLAPTVLLYIAVVIEGLWQRAIGQRQTGGGPGHWQETRTPERLRNACGRFARRGVGEIRGIRPSVMCRGDAGTNRSRPLTPTGTGTPFIFREPLGQAREVKVALAGLQPWSCRISVEKSATSQCSASCPFSIR
jgi:hypothetical protein